MHACTVFILFLHMCMFYSVPVVSIRENVCLVQYLSDLH